MVVYCSWNGLMSLYAWGDAEVIHRFEETCTIGTYLLHSVIAYKIRNACKLPKITHSFPACIYKFSEYWDAWLPRWTVDCWSMGKEKAVTTASDNKNINPLSLRRLDPLQWPYYTLKAKYKTTKKILQYVKDTRKQMYFKRINATLLQSYKCRRQQINNAGQKVYCSNICVYSS